MAEPAPARALLPPPPDVLYTRLTASDREVLVELYELTGLTEGSAITRAALRAYLREARAACGLPRHRPADPAVGSDLDSTGEG